MSIDKKTICVDFDGVINNYDGWKGVGEFNAPVEGVAKFVGKLYDDGWLIVIHTCRAEVEDIKNYLLKHNISYHYINYNPMNDSLKLSSCKPIADVYLDDRSVCFNGNWQQAYDAIMKFEPWHKRDGGEKVTQKTPDQLLEECAQLFRDKNTNDHYGNAYLEFGQLCNVLWPDGLIIKNTDDFNRVGIMFMILHKVLRISKIANMDTNGKFEKPIDNIKDLAVYAAMLAMLCEVAGKDE